METQLIQKIHHVFTEMKNLPDSEANPGNDQQQNNNQVTNYNVTFRVVNPNNNPLKATIALTDISDATNVVTKEDTGTITLSVKPGTYSVTVTKVGYDAPANIPNVTVTNTDVTVADDIVLTSQ